MELGEMKAIWKRQEANNSKTLSKEQFVMMLNNKMISFEEQIKRRDWLETAVAIIVILVCLIAFFYVQSVWSQLGCTTLIFASVFIVYKLRKARKKQAKEKLEPDKSFRDHLQQELLKLETQKELLESVLWWYLAPFFIGFMFLILGFNFYLIIKVVFLGVGLILYAYIWKLNQDAVSKQINPLISDIEQAITFISNNNE